jgi:DNA polymerase-1
MNQPTRSKDGKLVKQCFVAAPGCKIVAFDYSQIEMRVAAHVSQDSTMLKLFQAGEDVHAHTASWIFKIPLDRVDKDRHRYPAKRVGFGILYCLSATGLQKQLYMEGMYYSKTDCQGMIDAWFAMFRGIAGYMKGIGTEAKRFGCVRDLFGRYRLAPEMYSAHKWIIASGIRKMSNAPIQMGAQGIIKQAMIGCYPQLNIFNEYGICRPLLQIHDELLFEVQEDLLDAFVINIKYVMEHCVLLSLDTPVDVKVGDSWGALSKYNKKEKLT